MPIWQELCRFRGELFLPLQVKYRLHGEQARGANGFGGGRFYAGYSVSLVVPFKVLLYHRCYINLVLIILFLTDILKWLWLLPKM